MLIALLYTNNSKYYIYTLLHTNYTNKHIT